MASKSKCMSIYKTYRAEPQNNNTGINYIDSKSKSYLTPINPSKAKGITFVWVEIMILLGILFGVFNAENNMFMTISFYLSLVTLLVFIVLLIKHSKKRTPIMKAIIHRRLVLCALFFSLSAWRVPLIISMLHFGAE